MTRLILVDEQYILDAINALRETECDPTWCNNDITCSNCEAFNNLCNALNNEVQKS